MSRKGQFQNGNIPWNKGKKTGITGSWIGKHLTDEHKHNISESKKNKKPNKEHCERISKSLKEGYATGRIVPWNRGLHWGWNLGLTLGPEIRKHMSDAQKLWYKTHDSPLKGRKVPSEIIEKQRAGRLKYYENNEVWNKNRKHTITTRKRISQGMLRYWRRRKEAGEKSE